MAHAPQAEVKPSLQCVGTVSVRKKREIDEYDLGPGKNNGCDKSGNPMLGIVLDFTPDANSAVPDKRPVRYGAYMSPFVFDPASSRSVVDDQPEYQLQNYTQTVCSGEGKALFEVIFGDDYAAVVQKLEESTNFEHAGDGTVTDKTDWQKFAAELNAALDGRLISYCLVQQNQKAKYDDGTDMVDSDGKKVYVRTKYYEVNPRIFVKWDGYNTKLVKNYLTTFNTQESETLPF